MRRTVLLILALLLLLAGCGGAEGNAEANASASTPPPAATTSSSPTPEALDEAAVFLCQNVVDGNGAADSYAFLTELRDTGTISADEGFAGRLALYNLGGLAGVGGTDTNSPELSEALQYLYDQQPATRAALDAGSIDPAPLIDALEQAAEACQQGGFVVSWS